MNMSRQADFHKKAKHEANQIALDRLHEKYEQARNMQGSRLMYTLRKAAKSLQACPKPITTLKEAKALHGVGDSLARLILPNITESISLSRQSSIASSASVGKDRDSSSFHESARNKQLRCKTLIGKELCDDKNVINIISEKNKAYQASVEDSESLVLPSKDWKVILIVDGREHGWEKVLARLQMSGIPSEKRNLPIGDMAWIGRSGSVEIMLGTIVERKEVNDLASSLFGTRYKEQRLRLQNCGIPQLFLLVEGDTKEVTNCSQEQLNMAMMETRVHLNFQVVQTRHLDDTVRFLKSVHRRILQRSFPLSFLGDNSPSLPSFSSPTVNQRKKRRRSLQKPAKNEKRSFHEMVFDQVPVTPFKSPRFITYHELKCKVEKDREEGTKTIGAIFCSMLKQIHKISNSTIPPIYQAYPTPNKFFEALEGMNISEGKNLLSQLAPGTQKLGEQKCLELYHTFTALAQGEKAIANLSLQNPPHDTLLSKISEVSHISNLNPHLNSEPDTHESSSSDENSQNALLQQVRKKLSPNKTEQDHSLVSSNFLSIDLDKKTDDTSRESPKTVPCAYLDTIHTFKDKNSRESIDSLDLDSAFVFPKKPYLGKSRIDLSPSSDEEDSIDMMWNPKNKNFVPWKSSLDISHQKLTPPSCQSPTTHTQHIQTTSKTLIPSKRKQNLKEITNQFLPARATVIKEVIELLD
jgi:ERCC4-type nuclease